MNTTMDYIVAVGVVLTLIQTIYIAIPVHAARHAAMSEKTASWRGHLWAMVVMMLGAWAAFGFDYYDRHAHMDNFPCSLISEWGPSPDGSFHMNIDSSSLSSYANNYKIAFILNIPYTNIDRMTDTLIEKSELYTITNGFQSLAITGPHTFRAPTQSGAPCVREVAARIGSEAQGAMDDGHGSVWTEV